MTELEITEMFGPSQTRDEVRKRYRQRLGFDPCIPEKTAIQIAKEVTRGWVIRDIEFTGMRLTFRVMPRLDVFMDQLAWLECELSETYGNPPHTFATEFGLYHLTFIAN